MPAPRGNQDRRHIVTVVGGYGKSGQHEWAEAVAQGVVVELRSVQCIGHCLCVCVCEFDLVALAMTTVHTLATIRTLVLAWMTVAACLVDFHIGQMFFHT
jgi:hypothetical protein